VLRDLSPCIDPLLMPNVNIAVHFMKERSNLILSI